MLSCRHENRARSKSSWIAWAPGLRRQPVAAPICTTAATGLLRAAAAARTLPGGSACPVPGCSTHAGAAGRSSSAASGSTLARDAARSRGAARRNHSGDVGHDRRASRASPDSDGDSRRHAQRGWHVHGHAPGPPGSARGCAVDWPLPAWHLAGKIGNGQANRPEESGGGDWSRVAR